MRMRQAGRCLLSLWPCPCLVEIGNVGDAIGVEYAAVPVSLPTELKCGNRISEHARDLVATFSVHPSRGQSKSPVDAVYAEVCGLDGVGHVGGNKEWGGHDPGYAYGDASAVGARN